MQKKTFFALSCLIAGLSLTAEEADSSLLFKAGFDSIAVTADHAAGSKDSSNFKPPSLQLRMHEGVAGKGNALTLNNRERVAYKNYLNHDPKQGTVSLWIAPKNWAPDKKKFQIFFDSVFPGGTRFMVYKIGNDAMLRFLIFLKNKEVGNVYVPMKNVDWTPGRWHKIDAVWDANMMAVYVDGALAKPMIYTKNPVKFKTPLVLPDGRDGGAMRLGASPGFAYDKDDVTAFDELEIYNRVLTPAEIQQNYEKFMPQDKKKSGR